MSALCANFEISTDVLTEYPGLLRCDDELLGKLFWLFPLRFGNCLPNNSPPLSQNTGIQCQDSFSGQRNKFIETFGELKVFITVHADQQQNMNQNYYNLHVING